MKNFNLSSIVLLAGNSKRMGQPKQHSMLAGQTFLQHIVGKLQAQAQFLEQMVFVGQSSDLPGQEVVRKCGGVWVNNPQPENGPLSSIRLALQKISEDSAIILWPVDHPMIASNTITSLINSWRQNAAMITIPSDGLRRGHPAIFPAWCRSIFFEIDLNQGARQILQLYPERINHIATDDIWITRNLNTPELLSEAENWLTKKATTTLRSSE
jgi:molybdenum cofactor cytidylyltransferase